MSISDPGERWKAFYEGKELTWCVPESVTPEQIRRHAQSPWIQKLLKATGVQAGARVLEAGCGTGMFALSLASLGYRVDAFDYNEGALELARTFAEPLRAAQPQIEANFFRGNLLEIECESERYELTFNQAVMEYFCDAEERKKALSEMTRVTRRGGHVALIVQHTGHRLRGYWEARGWEGYLHQPPVIEFTPARLEAELREAGLVNVVTDGINPWKVLFFYPPWYQRWRVTNEAVYLAGRGLERVPLPRGARRQMATQILGVGQKP